MGIFKYFVVLEVVNNNFGVVFIDFFRYSGVLEVLDWFIIFIVLEMLVYVIWIFWVNGGFLIIVFKVEYKWMRISDWLVVVEDIFFFKFLVEVCSLELGLIYKFRVIVINYYGESFWSLVFCFY